MALKNMSNEDGVSSRSMDMPMPTQAEVDELLAFLPVFSAPEYEPVRQWHGGPAGKPQSLTPFPEYDDAVEAFIDAASKDCWKDRFYVSSGASRMLEEDGRIQGASLANIKSMLTFCVRGERFCDGHVGDIISKGYVMRILERLAEITKS